jgi:ATP-binding cassette subfamily B protein
VLSGRVTRRFRDKVTIALEAHVARLQARIATIAHQERPEFLDRLSVLRQQIFVLDHMYMSLFSTCGWLLRLGVVVILLIQVHPALALLALCALPTVLTSSWRPGVERGALERVASSGRIARHLFTLASSAAPGKEVRVAGIGERLVRERREAWERWYRPVARARTASALWHALAWAVFGLGYVGAIVFVTAGLGSPPETVLLVLAAGSRLSAVRERRRRRDRLPARHLDRRLAAARLARGLRGLGRRVGGSRGAGAHRRGHPARGVSFAYPGTERLVLEGVDLTLPRAR